MHHLPLAELAFQPVPEIQLASYGLLLLAVRLLHLEAGCTTCTWIVVILAVVGTAQAPTLEILLPPPLGLPQHGWWMTSIVVVK
jgi:hypothetical protein